MKDLVIHILERDAAADWAEAHLKKHPNDYWLRIPDTSSGIKPFDGVLYCSKSRKVVAIEFKVWRKNTSFDWRCVTSHQLRELLRWKKAGGLAWVLVYHCTTRKWNVYVPTRGLLAAALKRASGLWPEKQA